MAVLPAPDLGHPAHRASPKPRPNVDIAALTRFLEAIKSYSPDLIFGLKPGQPLYHYTDLAGLKGIVTDHDLWLTHSRYSNDDEELTHGYRVAETIVQEARNDSAKPAGALRTGRATGDRLAYLDAVADLLRRPTSEGVYICCFCRRDNLLSQWRSYGANGIGVSLKVDPTEFSNVTGPDSPPSGLMRLWKVFYGLEQQRRIVRRALDFAYEHPPTPSLPVLDRARQAADAISFFIPTFKNEDFKEEQEWRLIFTPLPNSPVKPQFRVARGMLVPYYSLRALRGESPKSPYRLPITGARVGPSVRKSLNLVSVQMLLAQAGYEKLRVLASETPYRG